MSWVNIILTMYSYFIIIKNSSMVIKLSTKTKIILFIDTKKYTLNG